MANQHWMSLSIYPSNFEITIRGVILKAGKLFREENQQKVEINELAIEGVKIPAGKSYKISTDGGDDPKEGTIGSFEVYDGNGFIGRYFWECAPRGLRNSSEWTPAEKNPSKRQYTTELSNKTRVENMHMLAFRLDDTRQ